MTENEVVQLVTEKKPLRKPFEETRFGEKDDFDREIIADNIIKLLDSDLTDCYPMAIDGGWGTGKSEFCHKLINKLRDNAANYKPRNVIYFDAFEAENVEEPLLSLLAKITEVVPEAEKKPLISKIVPVAKYGLGVTLKGLANHIFRQNGDTLSEGFQDAFADGATSGIDKLLKEYSQAKTHLQALKDCIEQALKTEELVIFIDELDRCRPDFALNVFELVKHVFDIPRVKFIFIVNSEQIKAIIRNRYGDKVDADIYLEKFIYRTIQLPGRSRGENSELKYNSLKIIYDYGHKNGITPISGNQMLFSSILENIYSSYCISLRSAEEIVKNIKIYQKLSTAYKFNEGLSSGEEFLVFLGILLYSVEKDISSDVSSNMVDFNRISNIIGTPSNKNFDHLYIAIKTVIRDGKDVRDRTYNNYSTNRELFSAIHSLFGTSRFYNAQEIIIHVIKTLNFCG